MKVTIYQNLTTQRLYATSDSGDIVVCLESEGTSAERANSRPDGRQSHLMRDGSYGLAAQIYILAAERMGKPVYYAWHGIVNSLGDHSSVTPPILPSAKSEYPKTLANPIDSFIPEGGPGTDGVPIIDPCPID